MRPRQTLLVLCLLLAPPAVVGAERINPFAPPLASQPDEGVTRASPRHRAAERHPRLRAVLQSIDGSMANLNGHILGEQEAAMGYRLLAVQEHSADFLFRGKRVRLHVANDTGTSTP